MITPKCAGAPEHHVDEATQSPSVNPITSRVQLGVLVYTYNIHMLDKPMQKLDIPEQPTQLEIGCFRRVCDTLLWWPQRAGLCCGFSQGSLERCPVSVGVVPRRNVFSAKRPPRRIPIIITCMRSKCKKRGRPSKVPLKFDAKLRISRPKLGGVAETLPNYSTSKSAGPCEWAKLYLVLLETMTSAHRERTSRMKMCKHTENMIAR